MVTNIQSMNTSKEFEGRGLESEENLIFVLNQGENEEDNYILEQIKADSPSTPSLRC